MWKRCPISRSMLLCGFLCVTVLAQEPGTEDEAELRLARLEQLAGKIKIGGWLDFEYFDSGESGQNDFFNVHHVYLNFDVKVSDHWLAYVEIEYENIPEIGGDEDDDGRILLDRGYIEYRYHAGARLQLGKFNTPAGIWKPEHWAITTDTIQEPIMEDNQYIPSKSVGVQFLGSHFSSLGEFNYAALISNGSEISNTAEPVDDIHGRGLDLRFTFQDRFMVGTSYHAFEDYRGGRESTLNGAMAYASLGIIKDVLELRGEYLHVGRSDFPDLETYYDKLKWQINHSLYLNLRYDRGDDERRAQGESHTAHGFTVGIWPHRHVRMKFELVDQNFEAAIREDYLQWTAWIGLVF